MTLKIEAERNRQIAKIMAGIPQAYRGIYKKALAGKSLAAIVKAKCLDCTNWQRTEITLCPCYSCPMWLRRPYQSKLSAPNQGTLEAIGDEGAI